MMYGVGRWKNDVEPEQFNALFYDNRGRFFLVAKWNWADHQAEWKELPGTAFNEVSIREACEWAVRANEKCEDALGTFGALIGAVLKFLPDNNSKPQVHMGKLLPDACVKCLLGRN
jgi:hypothetical protein